MQLFSKNDLPDIDDLIRKWKDRLLNGDSPRSDGDNRNRNRNGGGSGSGSGGNMKLPPLKLMAVVFMSLLVLVYLFGGFFTVDASERAVMFRFGNPIGVRGPGLKWHLPLVEDYRIVNVLEVQRVEIGYRNDAKNKNLRESLMLTEDLNIIDMQFVVQYALNDAELFLFENRFSNQRAEDVVKQVAETAMRQVVGRSGIDFVLYEGREAVAEETRMLMQSVLDYYKAGIDVQQVAVQNVQPPDQVQDAFEDAIKARQDRERKINEGQAYANDILPRSQGQAARILKEAEAYKESVIVRADGETDRFLLLLAEYQNAPVVTRRRLYLETLEQIMQRANKVIIDDNAGDGNLLYLPLDKLTAGAGFLPRQQGGNGEDSVSPLSESLDEFKDRLRQSGIETLEQRR